ncbi:MAG: antibiotic biosynthesis monooxygenase [Chloroflexi bacterium]|nr:antibiotic biosynthesis monooxygenase [Chloroflexota bacterium]MCY3603687.1 antibiotic biosynthesis monooxygenase [Chloroflexota bacterium]
MPTTLWRLKVAPDKQAEFERLTSQLVRDVAENEPESIFEYRRGVEDPLTYVLFLSFDDEQAFQRYSTADYHTGASGQIMECLAEAPVPDELERF